MQQAGLRLFFLQEDRDRPRARGEGRGAEPAPGKTAPHNAQVLVYMGAYRTNH